MKHWEFLLQKAGDRSWLPLDSPDVEILEGRYRVVARSDQRDIAVEIRISHISIEESPPKRRVQKRTGRTNQEGLMVVIPFTKLAPGIWELQCASQDVMSDLLGVAWQSSVQLHVVPHDADVDDWEPDWSSPSTVETSNFQERSPTQVVQPEPALSSAPDTDPSSISPKLPQTAPPQTSEMPAAAAYQHQILEILSASSPLEERLRQLTEQISEQVLDELLQDVDESINLAAPGSLASSQSTAVESQDSLTAVVFSLTLDQEMLIADRGEALVLSGQVERFLLSQVQQSDRNQADGHPVDSAAMDTSLSELQEIGPSNAYPGGTIAQELQLSLRDPQTLQTLVSDRQLFSSPSLPQVFTFTFTLPRDTVTRLILGEVLLWGVLPGSDNLPVALATQAFTVTINPNELVEKLKRVNEVLANKSQEDPEALLELSSRLTEQEPLDLDLSFLNLASSAPISDPPPSFFSLAGQPLPPQIYHPDPEAARNKSLELPGFLAVDELGNQPDNAENQEVTSQAEAEPFIPSPEASSLVADGLSDSQVSAEPINPALQDKDNTDLAESESQLSLDVFVSETAKDDDPPEQPMSPVQEAFRALNLQNRFLSRLSELAIDSQPSQGKKIDASDPSNSLDNSADSRVTEEIQRWDQEVVVEDDPIPLQDQRQVKAVEPSSTIQPELPTELPTELPNPLILSEDTPVPTPDLQVPAGELTAGNSINIRVKLPNLLPRIYVKFWVNDRQTRSLLDGPHWLVDLVPDGRGSLEAMTTMTVPLGSFEVRFEAIAVEVQTQRESHKVSVDRQVVPPDLPAISLEDFDP